MLLLALQTIQVHADNVQFYDHPVSAEELGSKLFNAGSSAPQGIKMRSINFVPKQKSPMEIEKSVEAEQRASIGLPIEFSYNSTEILPDSKPFLDEVGKMLNLPQYESKRLIIEGHTDATGSDSYNLALSKRRAQAVSKFLIQNYGISPRRLKASGLGEQSPLAGRDPYDEVNRRVQFYGVN
jgi:outer membrane protein OmpA-like peptidoglycan-associated protein